MKELEDLDTKLINATKRAGEAEKYLEAATYQSKELEKKLIDFGNGLPAVKKVVVKKTVAKLTKSEWFNDLLTLRHNAGWCAAHRVVFHLKGLNEDAWAEYEEA